MNALKGAVIVMSVLIAILMTLMVYGLYQKSQNPDFKFFNFNTSAPTPQKASPQAPVSGADQGTPTSVPEFGNISLDLPQGTTIISATPSGTQLIIVTASDGVHADQVWMVDMASGKVLGHVNTGQ
jgi:hypothetical protein